MKTGSILLAGAISDAERDLFTREFGDAITTTPSEDVRFAVVWKPKLGLMAQLPRLEAIFSLGAGVDHVLRACLKRVLYVVTRIVECVSVRDEKTRF